MTGKEYFISIRNKIDIVKHMARRIDEMRAMSTAIGGFDYSKPDVQTFPEKNITEDRVIELADLILKMEEMRAIREAAIREAYERIETLSRNEYTRVLLLRYLGEIKHSYGWIADEMGYTEDWVKHLHAEALSEFEERYL